MKTSLQCPRCRACRIWNVRNAVEHSAQGPMPLGEPQRLSPLELFMCAECGFCEWYTARPQSLAPYPDAAVVELNDHRFCCRHCQSREHLLVARFEEAERSATAWVVPLAVMRERNVASGTFAVVVCRDCGVLIWFACDFHSPSLEVERSCDRCGAAALARIDRVEEAGGHTLPIAMRGRREIGRFRLDVCVACGLTDWFGERFLFVLADGRDILLLHGVARPAAPREKTPYR